MQKKTVHACVPQIPCSNALSIVKREYQQDATVQMFIVNVRCFLLTTVSTCFGHHYAHHQENKDRVLLHMVFALVVLDVAGSGFVMLRCRV